MALAGSASASMAGAPLQIAEQGEFETAGKLQWVREAQNGGRLPASTRGHKPDDLRTDLSSWLPRVAFCVSVSDKAQSTAGPWRAPPKKVIFPTSADRLPEC